MTVSVDLPSGWIRAKLSDVATVRGEKALPSSNPGLPFIGMDHVEPHSGRIIGQVPAAEMKSAAACFRKGDVLYGRLRPYLNKVAMPSFDGLASAEFIVFVENDVLSSRFVAHRLRARDFVSFASHLNEGDRPRVDYTQIGPFVLDVPPLPEQHRIVARIEELFSELDASVESLTKARALLGLYRQSLLKAAFHGKLTADWRAANPDKLEPPETLLPRIRKERETRYVRALDDWQTALSEWRNKGEKGRKPQKPDRPPELVVTDSLDDTIPNGWVTVLVAGLMRGPLSNGRSVKDRTGGFPVLRLTAFRRGRLDLREFKEGAWTAEEAEPWTVQENDFFVVRGNGSKHLVGIGALAQSVSKPVAYPDTMIRLPADPACVDPAFFLLLWNSRVVRDQIEVAARTTAGIYKINQPHIEGFRVPLSPMGEQRLIVERLEAVLSQVDQQETEITAALTRIAALRQSILKRAFSGRLVSQGPDDEPASALLARLQSQTPTTPARRKRRA